MICFVCALFCEAKALIEAYQLNQISQKPFRIYQNKQTYLIISGPGKINSAAAVVYLYSFLDRKKTFTWINVGIGGAKSQAIGTVCVPNKVIDSNIKNSIYPVFLFKSPHYSSTLMTVDRPMSNYEEDVIYDMEAYSFFTIANKITTMETIQCIKIISDNQESDFNQLTNLFIETLIADNVSVIRSFVEKMEEVAIQLSEFSSLSSFYESLLNRVYFTETQKTMLKRAIYRFEACVGILETFSEEMNKLVNAKDVIRYLEYKIENSPLNFKR